MSLDRWARFRRLQPSALAGGVALATLGLCVYLPHRFPAGQATITIDLLASGGKSLQVFVNDLTVPPLTQALEPGVRRSYTFHVSDDVLFLRIDPTDAAGATVDIHAVEVAGPSATRARFEPADLRTWSRADIVKIPGDTPAFCFRTTGDDPMLWTTPNLVLSQNVPGWLAQVVGGLRSRRLVLTVFTIAWSLWVAVGAGRRQRWAYVPISVAAVASVVWLIPLVASLPDQPPPVNVAVGRAAVMGLSLRARQMAVLAAVVATALVALIAALVERKWCRREGEGDSSIEAMPSVAGERRRTLWLAVACVIVVASFLPDLRGLLDTARVQTPAPHWDGENLLYWAYLVSRGAIPYRDFWYPYGGFFIFGQPIPTGPLLKAAYEAAVSCLFALVFYRASGRKVGTTLAATLLLLLGDRSGLFPDLHRYLLATNVLLSFMGTAVATGWGGYALFWLACSLALFFEPAQLLYAAPGIAVVAALDALDRPLGRPQQPARHLARALAIPALVAGAYLAWLHNRGQLEGFLTFNLALGDTTAYSALPADIATLAHLPHSSTFFLLVAAPLLLGIGLFERTRGRRSDTLTASLLIGLGTVATMMLQKALVRPDGTHLLYLVPLGALSAIFLVRARRSVADRMVIGCFLGAVAAAFVLNGGATSLAKGILGAPRRLASGLSALRDQAALREARQVAFAEERLVRFADERALARRLRGLNGGRPPEVFALSDAPILYVLLKRVVYHANLYNASPIYEQRRIVDWLCSQEVPYVVFDPSSLTFDGFPKAVRAPLVFARVVQDYVPVGREGRYEITRRRRPGEPVALEYWRDKLGPSVFLGQLPRLSNLGRLRPCAGPGAPCQETLQVMVTASAVTRVSLPIEVQGLRYKVNFEAVPDVTRYYVSLDRIWFWSAARANGLPVRLATERMPPEVVAGIVMKAARPVTLY